MTRIIEESELARMLAEAREQGRKEAAADIERIARAVTEAILREEEGQRMCNRDLLIAEAVRDACAERVVHSKEDWHMKAADVDTESVIDAAMQEQSK